MLDSRKKVEAYTKQLVETKSIVNTEGEKDIANTIHQIISSFPYFQQNPSHLMIEQTTQDTQERYNVLAFVKGTKRKCDRTVILMGHTDTVGIDDFNQLKQYACYPDELMQQIKNEELPADIKKELDSDEWMFGRGALDMKSGLASHLYLVNYYALHPEKLEGNIVFLAECDEEDSSHGILSALKTLIKWKEEHHFNYVAAINADFVSPRYNGDPNRYIYKGTIGKLLPSFFITGEETHVGSCFSGLDPNYIAAELTRQINYNPELCDIAYEETTVPPVSLKQTDLKPSYTVQTALSAYVYYNFFTHSWTPKEVLHKLKDQAYIAFKNALDSFQEKQRKFSNLRNESVETLTYEPRVYTYEEMDDMLVEKHDKQYTNHMKDFKEMLLKNKKLDTRMFAARVVEEAWEWMEDKSPTIILFYSSLYSPSISLSGETEKEKDLLQALDVAIEKVQPNYSHPIVTRNFYPYISDMSFMALNDDEEGINAITTNNPSWGTKHFVDYEDVRALNVPIINIGPYGNDGHKKLERVEKRYAFEIVPNLTDTVIQEILNNRKP
ncbi:M20/M25/M40 family metallo-hydrolase [Oceanobacillus halotolerans]|uniref:M20/M25/M40 family metallo-hydrolase n=1 Tax=Oceanobacillus halotolerans TaxID=2663380 RepID=UPI0013D8F9C9|nr:M20/M25/M40 family metallo-hydrolase [Oceanobacillus halotolerans]